jgi:XTP/dITP diphosphohydrolase
MKTLLLATHNQAKLEELKMGVKPLIKEGVKIVTLNDLNIKQNPKETGKTFRENAKLKAKFYGDLTGYPTIADDGGLIIPFLNNEPGVKSRRWLGYEASDEELITNTLKQLAGQPREKRTAYLQVCLCFYNPFFVIPAKAGIYIDSRFRGNDIGRRRKDSGIIFCQQEKIKGYIAEKPSGKATNGYPFRALFIVEKYNKYYDELTKEEHQKINHRFKSSRCLVNKILNVAL